ncbi:hypothetical protein DSECCO2_383700 [anaerobic digester metagenome]
MHTERRGLLIEKKLKATAYKKIEEDLIAENQRLSMQINCLRIHRLIFKEERISVKLLKAVTLIYQKTKTVQISSLLSMRALHAQSNATTAVLRQS